MQNPRKLLESEIAKQADEARQELAVLDDRQPGLEVAQPEAGLVAHHLGGFPASVVDAPAPLVRRGEDEPAFRIRRVALERLLDGRFGVVVLRALIVRKAEDLQ